ncbi:MAG: PIN domain-containing protein [Melioribacteraceae bacterium]|nr:PIN domain-containing protein [Melioribacteraceae bacterium]
MNKKVEFLIETDIILLHLLQDDISYLSELEIAMINGDCFTSVINATEIYFNNYNEEEKKSVDAVLNSLKVLGIHSRYSLNISEFFNKVATPRDAIICSLAKFNKLPILTYEFDRYKNSGIKIISPLELRG